jgi:hypothetical protein
VHCIFVVVYNGLLASLSQRKQQVTASVTAPLQIIVVYNASAPGCTGSTPVARVQLEVSLQNGSGSDARSSAGQSCQPSSASNLSIAAARAASFAVTVVGTGALFGAMAHRDDFMAVQTFAAALLRAATDAR